MYTAQFNHGVASGDPLSDSIVLWTRVTPTFESVVLESDSCDENSPSFEIRYFVSKDGGEVTSGTHTALCANDWTVKIDVVGLDSGVKYSYGFESSSYSSPQGRFRLPTDDMESLAFAVFSCANLGYGYFNAYGHAASLDLDFSLFLGDYIYEYDPSGSYIVRQSEDLLSYGTRLDTVTDYRKRYESYHKDPDLRALRAAAPLIAAWDDHEFANDAFQFGAGNHDDTLDGPWNPRKEAAARAFEEWMPIRTTRTTRRRLDHEDDVMYAINRTFDFGTLARLTMVESRVTARTNPYTEDFSWGQDLDVIGQILDSHPGANESVENWDQSCRQSIDTYAASTRAHASQLNRSILGESQLEWLSEKIEKGSQTWQIVGQQQVLQPCALPNYTLMMNQENEWNEALENATSKNLADNPTLLIHSPLKKYDDTRGSPHTISPYERRKYLQYLAAGEYGVVLNFDGWNGYVAERDRFVEALRSTNKDKIVVLGGDSHNGWVGMLSDVAAEFDGQATTSPGIEKSFPYYDPEMVSQAYVSTNPDMKWADTSNKGYMLVELNRENVHVEYIFVTNISNSFQGTISSRDCGKSFDFRGRSLGIQDTSCRLLESLSSTDSNNNNSSSITIALAIIISVTVLLSVVPLTWILRTNCACTRGDSRASTRPFSALQDEVELPETPRAETSSNEEKSERPLVVVTTTSPGLTEIEI